jgi:hypothetical protein
MLYCLHMCHNQCPPRPAGVVALVGAALLAWRRHSQMQEKPHDFDNLSSSVKGLQLHDGSAVAVFLVEGGDAGKQPPAPTVPTGAAAVASLDTLPDYEQDDAILPVATGFGAAQQSANSAVGPQVGFGSRAGKPPSIPAPDGHVGSNAGSTDDSGDRVQLLEERLGAGAFGTVRIGIYRGQRVAVKIMTSNLAATAKVRRLHAEASRASKPSCAAPGKGSCRHFCAGPSASLRSRRCFARSRCWAAATTPASSSCSRRV